MCTSAQHAFGRSHPLQVFFCLPPPPQDASCDTVMYRTGVITLLLGVLSVNYLGLLPYLVLLFMYLYKLSTLYI